MTVLQRLLGWARGVLARLRGRGIPASPKPAMPTIEPRRRVEVEPVRTVSPEARAEASLAEAQQAFDLGSFAESLQKLRQGRPELSSKAAEQAARLWRRLTERCRLVSLRSARLVSSVENGERIHATRLYRNGRHALAAGSKRSVHFWDLQARQCARSLNGHQARILSVDLSADGAVIASGSADGRVGLWKDEQDKGRMLEGHTSLVSAVSLSADGGRLLSGSYDHTLRLWNVETAECTRVLEGHNRQIVASCLSKDGRVAVSGSYEGELRIWDVDSGACLHTIAAHPGQITALDLSADGRMVVSAGKDGKLNLWDTQSGSLRATLDGDGTLFSALAICANSGWVFCATEEGETGLWDTVSGQLFGVGDTLSDGISTASLSSDACWALAASPSGRLSLWELDWELGAP